MKEFVQFDFAPGAEAPFKRDYETLGRGKVVGCFMGRRESVDETLKMYRIMKNLHCNEKHFVVVSVIYAAGIFEGSA